MELISEKYSHMALDFFDSQGAIPFNEWLMNGFNKNCFFDDMKKFKMREFVERLKLFNKAYNCYAANGCPDDLRMVPYVMSSLVEPNEDYPGCESYITYFIFKEDNGGTTYLIKSQE